MDDVGKEFSESTEKTFSESEEKGESELMKFPENEEFDFTEGNEQTYSSSIQEDKVDNDNFLNKITEDNEAKQDNFMNNENPWNSFSDNDENPNNLSSDFDFDGEEQKILFDNDNLEMDKLQEYPLGEKENFIENELNVETHKENNFIDGDLNDNFKNNDNTIDEEPEANEHREEELVDNDDHLGSILDVLKDIHYDYFKEIDALEKENSEKTEDKEGNKYDEENDEVDIKEVIEKRRKRTLKGCNLVMFEVSNKDLLLASRFGATLYRNKDQKVTHIVTNNPTLPEVENRTEEDRMYVVNTTWLHDSIFRWERQDELKYGLPGIEVLLGHPPIIHNELGLDEEEENENNSSDIESEYSSSSLDENLIFGLENLEKEET